MENITGNNGIVQKFRIKDFYDDFILKVNVPQDISYAKYIIRYYFTKEKKEENYKLNKTFSPEKVNHNNDIILKFNKIEIISKNNTKDRNKLFKIFGFLYSDENDIKGEFFNSSKKMQGKFFKNYTFIQNDTDFSLYFTSVKSSKKNNYIFNLLMKIIVFEKGTLFNEDFFVYRLKVNLEDELKEKFPFRLVIIIICPFIFVIIIIIIIFTIGFIKLKKNNTNLKEKVLAISFTTGKIDEEIIEKKNSKNDEDYENTFI
jgi:hypothetical protein